MYVRPTILSQEQPKFSSKTKAQGSHSNSQSLSWEHRPSPVGVEDFTGGLAAFTTSWEWGSVEAWV